ncbi:hypothetical protein AAE478_001835 [Parahypoxylon ruwenzoriense]
MLVQAAADDVALPTLWERSRADGKAPSPHVCMLPDPKGTRRLVTGVPHAGDENVLAWYDPANHGVAHGLWTASQSSLKKFQRCKSFP